ncbi:PEP-CTERM sorting domain-containing protein [Verrucomicrobiaceae bacterium N1E253]|uniref:PEP-CTERM sorting domain-containing protein n=1 Tax=Oceaniferula marina TaxID=2748318 RepID=A0A851GJC1_9BACT|nr:PEP-CTERM sorting domain-containing protein [Oceaniferula marina]NWK54770.1 PEP-CTERM sorting domain-containing protein [Oceaniferula marina]
MKHTTSILLALTTTVSLSSAAVTVISTDPTTYTDASTGEGNWHYQSLTLNDSGFTVTGGSLDANMNLESVTFAHDTASTTDGLYLVAMTDVQDTATIVAQSTNSINMTGLSGGDLLTWTFDSDTLSTSTQYFFAWYQDTSGDGIIGAGDTDADARIAMKGNVIAGQLRNAPTGGISTNDDAMMNIQLTAVPEPSSAALLGLGGLSLILRRRK